MNGLIAIISFHNKATGPQSWLAFSKKYRHCNLMTFDGHAWVLIDFDGTGIKTHVFKDSDAEDIIARLKRIKSTEAIFTIKVLKRKTIPWWPLWGRTCTEMVRYCSGADVGKTFNPAHLYKKLLKYDGKRNYMILSHWMR